MKRFAQIHAVIQFINNHPLAGKHRMKAYLKFIKWQVGQFIKPGKKKVSFVGPTFLLINRGMAGATGNIYTGLHEFADMGFLLHFLRKGDLFADIGANIGSYTVLAAGYVGAKAISFEPVPETFNNLQKNIELNQIEKLVTAYNVGISSGESKLLFTSSYDTVNHVIPVSEKTIGEPAIEVKVVSLDEIVKGSDVPSLIKIDVEGFETEVVRGMEKTLKNQSLKAIIIELNGSGARYGYDEISIHEILLQEGFLAYRYDPFERRCIPIDGYGIHNTLYLRNMNFIDNRVRSAEKITLFSELF